MDRDRLGDLLEPDQLQPVESLGARFVAVHLRQPRVDGGVGWDDPVDVRESEEPANPVHHRDHGGVHQPAVAELANVQLDVGSLYTDQRVKTVHFAPGEPPELVGIQGVVGP
jgi:hypothetical protein